MDAGDTGYGWLNAPGTMVETHISPNVTGKLERIVKSGNYSRSEVISGLLNAAYDSSDIGNDLQDPSVYNVYCSVFEGLELAIVLSAFNHNITALLVTDIELQQIENTLSMNKNEVDLGWIKISFGVNINLPDTNRFSIN